MRRLSTKVEVRKALRSRRRRIAATTAPGRPAGRGLERKPPPASYPLSRMLFHARSARRARCHGRAAPSRSGRSPVPRSAGQHRDTSPGKANGALSGASSTARSAKVRARRPCRIVDRAVDPLEVQRRTGFAYLGDAHPPVEAVQVGTRWPNRHLARYATVVLPRHGNALRGAQYSDHGLACVAFFVAAKAMHAPRMVFKTSRSPAARACV